MIDRRLSSAKYMVPCGDAYSVTVHLSVCDATCLHILCHKMLMFCWSSSCVLVFRIKSIVCMKWSSYRLVYGQLTDATIWWCCMPMWCLWWAKQNAFEIQSGHFSQTEDGQSWKLLGITDLCHRKTLDKDWTCCYFRQWSIR